MRALQAGGSCYGAPAYVFGDDVKATEAVNLLYSQKVVPYKQFVSSNLEVVQFTQATHLLLLTPELAEIAYLPSPSKPAAFPASSIASVALFTLARTGSKSSRA